MRSFNELSITEATDNWKNQIKSEVERQTKEYILKVDENEYLKYLQNRYALEPLVIDLSTENIGEPVKKRESRESRFHDERYVVDVYYFTISYQFTGASDIFRLRPNPWSMTSYDINVNEHRGSVSFTFGIDKQDAGEFNRQKEQAKSAAFANLNNANTNINAWNNQLSGIIEPIFRQRKASLLKENEFFAAINLKVNDDTNSLFSVPVIQRKILPQPNVDKKKVFSASPSIAQETYEHLLELLNGVGRGMERKPSLYKGKDENGIRDVFLSQLELRYDGVTATGETFNSGGKTDIILKYAPDGSNLFVAECKFWTGASGFQATITQLFDRYLTWRDSKVAVMMFVKGNDFTSVLNNIRTEARLHPYYVRTNGQHGETSFSYIFRLKQDAEKEVQMEVMAFHFDKI
ncbi:hypothetical protein KXD93_16730 [Mucilaginibacter sp. BJC16-A38]|uniref:hypothetical protein n=1 Tax=Mucilaginibacter phenanthrenivorans TaxID=1234842 RepID=UPI0021585AB4|nr:hypothetical protein [Mucilaginibacter phenanthrenivorans]MCR8559305.1 hypothetical protein [Mucilaginibacter phenanthrenivorans]